MIPPTPSLTHNLLQIFRPGPLRHALALAALSTVLASCGGGSGSSAVADSAPPVTSTTPATPTPPSPTATPSAFGLDGFTQCGAEGGSVTLSVKTHLAYGASNAFVYLFNQTGKIALDSTTFGSDPIFGTAKLVYCKPVVDGADGVAFSAALARIKNHLTGAAVLDAAQINAQAGLLAASMFTLVGSEATLIEALAVLDLYEKKEGVFFIGARTKGGFPNKPGALDGMELARAVFMLQQGVQDQAFTPTAFAKYRSLLGGKKFSTADFFPGKVKVAADPTRTYTA